MLAALPLGLGSNTTVVVRTPSVAVAKVAVADIGTDIVEIVVVFARVSYLIVQLLVVVKMLVAAAALALLVIVVLAAAVYHLPAVIPGFDLLDLRFLRVFVAAVVVVVETGFVVLVALVVLGIVVPVVVEAGTVHVAAAGVDIVAVGIVVAGIVGSGCWVARGNCRPLSPRVVGNTQAEMTTTYHTSESSYYQRE